MTSELDRLQLALPKRYTLLRELDRGGMSRVYLAREEMPDREVAIKVFDEKLSAQLGRERFVREVELTSQLGHPYIVPIHAAGDAEGALYYVMPFVRGESLRDRLEREGRLPIEDALRITEQVAGALTHAHEKGVVHRDIKPANILFHGGHAVVADFGIARALRVAETKGTLTHAGTALGTPDYMSPEQISGQSDVDARTDIYALACVLYEMLGGQPPFHSRTRQATLARHLADTVPSLRGLRDAVPKRVEDAIRRALSKAPIDRFASVQEFVRALRHTPASSSFEPGELRKSSRWIPTWRVSRRVAGVLVVVAAVGLAWNAWSDRSPATAVAGGTRYVDSVAITPFENLSARPELDNLGRFIAEDVSEYLQSMSELRVVNSYSVVTLWRTIPVPQLMDTLNIGSLIEGSIQPNGDMLEVRVQETNESGILRDTWTSRPFPAVQSDSAQRAIAREIAERYLDHVGLEGSLAYREDDPSPATEAYLAGNAGLGERTPEGISRAVIYYREAIDLDPDYAPAYSGLASAYALALYYKYDVGLSSYALAGQGLALADKAVELDPAHDGGYSARGLFRVLIGMEIDQAEADFARAGELTPNESNVAGWSARVAAQRGRIQEAYDLYDEALSLDPQNAGRRIGFVSLALQLGQYDTAVEEMKEALALEPTLALAAAFEGWALALAGQPQACLDLDLDVYELVQAVCLRSAGRDEEAAALVEATESSFPSIRSDYLDVLQAQGLAIYYGFLGDTNKATEWLNQAFDRSPAPIDARIIDSELMDQVRNLEPFESTYDRRREAAHARVTQERARARASM